MAGRDVLGWQVVQPPSERRLGRYLDPWIEFIPQPFGMGAQILVEERLEAVEPALRVEVRGGGVGQVESFLVAEDARPGGQRRDGLA
ncbi:hypothetical protein M911_16130 [Ectothiorhodospira haloalkaliphila]|uniref:Uncharacterized protein n=1 Tax=Ectothiorhodospira haloalkaliphila TaxID=421628 RepID=W8KNS5_9GAMM|nr:hypothetical protein M911_16130 [Ectothiorhodospira haloalkaliphila]